MIPLTALWLPILVSAIAVLIASNILWMALPFWHRRDYGHLPNDNALLDALSGAKSGQYIAPHVNWSKMEPAEREAMMARPMAFVLVRNPARFSFPAALVAFFIYLLIISTFVGLIAACAVSGHVTTVAFLAAVVAHSFGSVSDSIWYGKPWTVTGKEIVDGIIYGALTALVFAWLWPRV